MRKTIICKRYDVKGIINVEDLHFGLGFRDGYLNFFEWLDKPGYYLVAEDDEKGGMQMYHILNRTGEYDLGDGCPVANVAKPVSIGIFEDNFRWRFLDYILEKYVTDHIPKYNGGIASEQGWYKIEKLKPEKWLNEFIALENKKREEILKASNEVEQLSLF